MAAWWPSAVVWSDAILCKPYCHAKVAGPALLQICQRGGCIKCLWTPSSALLSDSVAHLHMQLWDLRAKRSAQTMTEDYQILAVAFAEAGDQIYTGGIENVIKVCADLRVANHPDKNITLQCLIRCLL